MNKNIEKTKLINSLKAERDYLLSRRYINRTQTKDLESVLETEIVKVILGPRRSGKSTLGLHTLAKNHPDFFYINFDNKEVLEIENLYSFVEDYEGSFENGKILFLDEVQNLPNFELEISRFQRNGYNIIMTGSNANLLSRELSTHLTGRYTEIEVLPFSYSEAKRLDSSLTVNEYLNVGGFPEQLINKETLTDYVETLFESVAVKDIIVRYNLRNVEELLKLQQYLISSPSQLSSYNKLKNKLGMSSVNTLIDYYGYLMEAYLIYKLNFFSPKQSEVLKSDFKTFLIDTGVFLDNPNLFNRNQGYLFENAIFVELIRQGYKPQQSLFQVKLEAGEEIDFLAKGEEKDMLVQVSLSVKDNETREREFKALQKYESYSDKPVEKIVVVAGEDEEELGEGEIKVMGFEDFCSMQ